jgi:hypothetical protein
MPRAAPATLPSHALEPAIDAKTMEIHHASTTRRTSTTSPWLEAYPDLQALPIENREPGKVPMLPVPPSGTTAADTSITRCSGR